MAFAQKVVVKDYTTREPLPGVHLFNADTTQTAITDADGEADISHFSAGDVIIFHHSSYEEAAYNKSSVKLYNNTIYLREAMHLLDEFVFSATRSEEKKDDVPFKIDIVDAKEIKRMDPQTSAELLEKTGQVFVQRSQMGGGSPNIRGFEANRVLLVVDGVRMNNAIYRGGHLQNVITIDNSVLDRVEVVFGPSSVMYGSDALGGVMHFYTKDPDLAVDSTPVRSTSYYIRHATVNNEKTIHGDVSWANRKTGFLTSVTFSDFGDLRTGRVHHPAYPEFGLSPFYVERINGQDSMIINDDPHMLRFTGYKQLDAMQKIIHKPSDKLQHTFNLQFSTSSNIPRYDRLITMDGDLPKYAEWHYGPQMRIFSSYKLSMFKKNRLWDNANLIFAYQNISEDRITRGFNDSEQEHREETINIGSANADFTKKLGTIQTNYGVEFTYNDVQSFAYINDIVSGEEFPTATRYPDGGSWIASSAVYFAGKWKPYEVLVVSGGIRYSYIRLHAEFEDTTFFPFPFRTADQDPKAFNGNLGITYMPGAGFRFNALASTGFKAPNIDDMGKVFDSEPGTVIVPNPDLEPEYAYSMEYSISKEFLDRKVKLEGLYFLTLLQKAIIVGEFTIDSSRTVIYDGQPSEVFANVNKGEAIIQGLSFGAYASFLQQFTFEGNVTITDGQNVAENMPLDRIPPIFGKVALTHKLRKVRTEFYVNFNGWKREQDYAKLSSQDRWDFATEDGMPAWYTLNLRTNIHLNRYLDICLGIENIADIHYRLFSTGPSAPGRNFTFTIHSEF